MVTMEDDPPGPDPVQLQAEPVQRLGIVHTGSRYAFGYGPDFYGIWDEFSPDWPAERFPATSEGRLEGWQRYVELEPSAREVRLDWLPVAPEEEQRGRGFSRRARWLLAAGVVAVVIIGAVIAAGLAGGGGPTAGSAAEQSRAHLDVSGGFSLSEDLSQRRFNAADLQSLYPRLEGQWAGQQSQLRVVLFSPQVGETSTAKVNSNEIEIVVQRPSGSPLTFASTQGECGINVQRFDEQGVSGTFICSAIPSETSKKTIDANGSFSGAASS